MKSKRLKIVELEEYIKQLKQEYTEHWNEYLYLQREIRIKEGELERLK